MKFDVNKVFTAVNADELKMGDNEELKKQIKKMKCCENSKHAVQDTMTDEEKANEYAYNNVCKSCESDTCTKESIIYCQYANKLYQAYLVGLKEGRKELEKENAKLKTQIEKIKKLYI